VKASRANISKRNDLETAILPSKGKDFLTARNQSLRGEKVCRQIPVAKVARGLLLEQPPEPFDGCGIWFPAQG
jgi:hypothetical protein